MQHPYETFLESLDSLYEAIKQEVISQDCFIRFSDNEDEDRFIPDGITDANGEVRILAVKYDGEEDMLAFFADPILLHCNVNYTDEDLLSDNCSLQWYYLGWDCLNPFIHNLVQIAHYLWPQY